MKLGPRKMPGSPSALGAAAPRSALGRKELGPWK